MPATGSLVKREQMGGENWKRERAGEQVGEWMAFCCYFQQPEGQARPQRVTSACSCARDLPLFTVLCATAGLYFSFTQKALVQVN